MGLFDKLLFRAFPRNTDIQQRVAHQEVDAIIAKVKKAGDPELDLRGWAMRYVPSSFDQLPPTQIRKLHLQGNNLKHVPNSVYAMVNLEELNITGGWFESISEDICRLTKLRELRIASDNLTNLPTSLDRLVNLRHLFVGGKELADLPFKIGLLTQLQKLCIRGTKLISLPQDIGKLVELEELIISNNRLALLPDVFNRLSKLHIFDAAENELMSLPKSLRECISLRELFLHDNAALGLPPDILGRKSWEPNTAPPDVSPKVILDYYFNAIRANLPHVETKVTVNPSWQEESPAGSGVDAGATNLSVLGPSSKLQVFLCHASKDKERVRTIYRWLIENGFAPWLDAENLDAGDDWECEIPKAVRRSHVILVCLSHHSISKEGYVQKEMRIAINVAEEKPEETIYIIPVKLEECEIPGRLARWHCVNLCESNGYDRLARSLNKRLTQMKQQ